MNDGLSNGETDRIIKDVYGKPASPKPEPSNAEVVERIKSGQLGPVRDENPNPSELEKARIEKAKAEQLFQSACIEVSSGISARAVIYNLTCAAQQFELEASESGDIQKIHEKFYYARSLRVAVGFLQSKMKEMEEGQPAVSEQANN